MDLTCQSAVDTADRVRECVCVVGRCSTTLSPVSPVGRRKFHNRATKLGLERIGTSFSISLQTL